ncbi:hypothetical protein [Thalassobacillus devorans]|uniref:hypothetical protein n=1 Tax=Thalassobacillus devorans TaxID=279813 RepID=UPI00048A4FDC|nr:hypothetical protein [Thalassobacillus devorans]
MKTWLVALLGLLTISIWSTVIFIAVTQDKSLIARPHNVKNSIVIQERSVPKIPELADLAAKDRETAVGGTIIGETAITKAWVEDVSKDGRLSIDTLLASLEAGEDPENKY